MYSMNLGPLSYRVLMSFTTYARGLVYRLKDYHPNAWYVILKLNTTQLIMGLP